MVVSNCFDRKLSNYDVIYVLVIIFGMHQQSIMMDHWLVGAFTGCGNRMSWQAPRKVVKYYTTTILLPYYYCFLLYCAVRGALTWDGVQFSRRSEESHGGKAAQSEWHRRRWLATVSPLQTIPLTTTDYSVNHYRLFRWPQQPRVAFPLCHF